MGNEEGHFSMSCKASGLLGSAETFLKGWPSGAAKIPQFRHVVMQHGTCTTTPLSKQTVQGLEYLIKMQRLRKLEPQHLRSEELNLRSDLWTWDQAIQKDFQSCLEA